MPDRISDVGLYFKILAGWLGLGASGFVLRFFFPIVGWLFLALFFLGPFYIFWSSSKQKDKTGMATSASFIGILMFLIFGCSKLRDQYDSERELKNRAANSTNEREFLPFNSNSLSSAISPITTEGRSLQETLAGWERARGAGSGFDIIGYSKADLSRVYIQGYDGRIRIVTLELGQNFDPKTNEEQIEIGNRLAKAVGLDAWYDLFTKNLVAQKTVKSDLKIKDEVAASLCFLPSEKKLFFRLNKVKGVISSMFIESCYRAKEQQTTEEKLKALLGNLNETPGLRSTIKGVSLRNYSLIDGYGIVQVTVSKAIWRRLSVEAQLKFVEVFKTAWAETINSEINRFEFQVIDTDGSTIAGTKEDGVPYVRN